jgi:DNA-binding transcriptional ArsR family regulator
MDRFIALADPTRRHIIESLCAGERAFGDIAADFDMSRPAVSQHLKVLKDTGFVTVRAEAQRRIYRLNNEGLEEVDEWLGKVRRFWAERLHTLEQALGEAPDTGGGET